MKKSFAIILTLGLIFIHYSCEEDAQDLLVNDSTIVSVEYGKSFGECIGYCFTSIKIESTDVKFLLSSWESSSKYPDINVTVQISLDEWNDLINSINFIIFRNMDEVIGCPDCADGGAEWIEITTDKLQHKITFEYRNEPDEVKDYITQLRDLMSTYEAQMEDSDN